MRRFLLVLGVILFAVPAWAQTGALQITDSITANGDFVILRNINGRGSAKVQVTGTYDDTWEAQCSVNGVTFDADDELLITKVGQTSTVSEVSDDAVSIWDLGNIAACSALRVIATAYTSGTQVVTIAAAPTGGGGGSGAGGTDGVTQGSTTSGQSGPLMQCAVTTAAPTYTTAQTSPCSLTEAGEVRVTDSALEQDVNDLLASSQNIEGDIDYIRTNLAVNSTVDNLAQTTGGQAMLYAQDFDGAALPGVVSAETDAVRAAGSLYGVSYVMLVSENGALQYGTTTTPMVVAQLDPCSSVAKTVIPIDIVTIATTEITAALAGASNNYYICGLSLVTAAANNVAVVDDDSDGCATPTSGVLGGFATAAEGFNFAANGGIALGNGGATVGKTNGVNRVICIITSAAVQLSGAMIVVAAP